MRTLKLLLVAVLITSSTVALADSNVRPGKRTKSVSYELETMLSKSSLVIEEDLLVTVLFTLSEDNKIFVKSIISENEKVKEHLSSHLNGKKLYGGSWSQDKLYELPIRVQANR